MEISDTPDIWYATPVKGSLELWRGSPEFETVFCLLREVGDSVAD